jgi:hypothetical protein
MSQSAELQLERAEFTQDKAPAATCRVCASNLGQSYYAVNGQPVCRTCCDRVRRDADRGTSLTRGLRASGAGALAALAGAILYYAILAITGYEFGLIAIVVGLMVGKAVNWGGGGRGGWRYQTVAVVLTYLAIVSAYVPPLFEAIRKSPTTAADRAAAPPSDMAADRSEPAQVTAEPGSSTTSAPAERRPTIVQLVFGLALLAALACAAPFLAGIQNMMGLVIIGIGLFEAWKFNKPREWRITGPHAIAVTPAPARG